VPTEGAFPLSFTLDSVGPIARSVAACAAADAVMAGDDPWSVEPAPLQGLRLGIPQGLPLRDLDQTVAARFSDATKELSELLQRALKRILASGLMRRQKLSRSQTVRSSMSAALMTAGSAL
jgi:Asp-tRNA(Asn)/Glu-tRNA(Gln) amidotransferase A subunit family amidase